MIEYSRKQEWLPCFCYINFSYKLQSTPPTDDVEWLKSYLGNSLTDFMIDDKNFPRHTWPNVGMRESANMQEALRNKASSYFANETFVVHRGNIISRYRKATYFNEDPVLIQKGWIYFFGRGYDEPTNEGGTLAHELVNRVGTDICRDIALRFKLWVHRLSLAQHDDQVRERFFASYPEATNFITKEFNVKNFTNRGDVSPFKFKIRIVQSSTVGVSEYLDNFSSGQIVIQSDPLVSGVTKIQWPSHTEKIVEEYQSGNNSAEPGWIARLNTPFVCHPILASRTPWQVKIKSSDFLQRSFTCVLYEIKGGS